MTPVEEIKSRLDIVEFVRGYVKLEKSGQNWRGLCPFHAEKTPSFFVSPSRQTWHCFGACSEGGDIFSFLMKIEHIEFPEALKVLAERAGIRLTREDPQLRSERKQLLDILIEAARWFEKNLENTSVLVEYLISRGLKAETIKTFHLGWAPPEWRGLFDHLTKTGFRPENIERAGLIIKSPHGTTGYYDRFRSRIMFPFFDSGGHVVGFTGRIFQITDTEDVEAAKYVNTPETPVFQKSKVLYGFHLSRPHIAREDSAILVEGQMDFLAAWQEGIKNVVATSGTAITDIQLQILKRIADTIILGFDMDKAGDQATERSILAAASMGFNVKILTLEEGKDIADFTKLHPGKLQKLIEAPLDLMKYYFAKARKSYPLDTIEGRKQFVEYFIPRLKSLASPTERAAWLADLSQLVGISERFLEEELSRAPLLTEPQRSTDIPPDARTRPQKKRTQLLGERALAFALIDPKAATLLNPFLAYFPASLNEIAIAIANGDQPPQNDFVNYLFMLAEYETNMHPELDTETEVMRSLAELRKESIKERLQEKTLALQEAERLHDDSRVMALTMEITQLTRELVQ